MHVVTGILASDVAQNGTFLSHYPTGTVQADFTGSEGHVLVVDSAEFEEADNEISLSFGASSITVTNLTARTFRAGTRIYLQLEPVVQATGVLGKSANEPTETPIEIEVGAGLLLAGRTLSAAGGAGLGDMIGANNLTDVADEATALANLGGAPAVGSADIEITDAAKGLILTSAGFRWRLTIDDTGTLIATSI